ncbi:Wzz/FepE/Etk N-terminal domain-containing protein [Bacillus sp. JJ634]
MKDISNTNNGTAKEINLKELFDIIKRRFWVVIILTVLFTLAGYFTTTTSSPLYQTSTRIIIEATKEKMKTLQVIIKDTTILQKVVDEMKLPMTPEALAGNITVESIDDSEVVSISVVSPDPYLAAEIANTTAKIFKEEVPNIVGFKNVRYLSDAKVNPYPINGNENSTILKYGIIGLIAGVGLVFLLNTLDYRLRSVQEIEELVGLPVIGQVSKMNKRNTNTKKNLQNINNSTATKQSKRAGIEL